LSHWLSESTGARVHLKLENQQMTGSFKERGACNKLALLDAHERSSGVVTASAGNHAQGVAYHASRLGIRALIVMPRSTPLVKLTSTRHFGAEVVLHGDDFAQAFAHAWELARETGATFVHPFDDAAVVAGQGTIGLELLEQVPDLEAVVAAVGGGGLIAGLSVAIKEQNPNIRVYGVQAACMPSMSAALRQTCPVPVPSRRTIADGIAVASVGVLPLTLAARYVDQIVQVDEEEIAAAILALLEREKTIAEGAGAAPLAALLSGKLDVSGRSVAVVIGGGNIDVNVLSRVIDRGLIKSGRLMRLHVILPDIPGALAKLLGALADCGVNVLQVIHDRHGARTELGQASVELELETRGVEHVAEIQRALLADGFETL
jgi:threonine dehydratase